MIVLDAYPVIAFLAGEAAADDVARLLRAYPERTLTPVGIAEVVDQLARVVGAASDEVVADLGALGLADAEALTAMTARRAALLRARHYHRRTRAVSLADCLVAQVAREVGGPVVTSDPALLDLCHAEGIELIVLPGRDGSRWAAPG